MNRILRIGIQSLILIMVIWTVITAGNPELYCPMGGILAFSTKIYQGTLPCSMSSAAIFMALVLFVGILAIGKLFCGFLCPVGTVSEWMGKIGGKLRFHKRLPLFLDRPLRTAKYGLLMLIFYESITSSELFCRKLDPYYGAATGFGHDTILFWALFALILVFIGGIFVKQFWCRYFCFLGAASNVFMNVWGAASIFAVYFLLNLVGVQLSPLWLIAGLAIMGFLWEIKLLPKFIFPILKISVNQNTCSHCGVCQRACPMDIPVDQFETLDHPDCTVCTECIHACKREKSVQINGSYKLRFVPIILLLAFISTGFVLSRKYEFSTISKRWGDPVDSEALQVFHQENLKNVKCYGSSMALYNQLLSVKGIYGLDTYASSHKVNVYYNPKEITAKQVKEKLFSPARYRIRNFDAYTPSKLAVVKWGIENAFDPIDQSYLKLVLSQNRFIFGMETSFGEPVEVKIYFDSDSVSIEEIKKMIQAKTLAVIENEREMQVELDFKCIGDAKIQEVVGIDEFNFRMYEPFDLAFNGYDKYSDSEVGIYEIEMPQAIEPALQDSLLFLVSALSGNSNIIRFQTEIREMPYAKIYFVKGKIDTSEIFRMLNADTLVCFIDESTTVNIRNPFRFED